MIRTDGLTGSSKGYLLARILESTPNATVIVISASADDSHPLCEDTKTFAAASSIERIAEFPEIGQIPYSKLSADPTQLSDRMGLLASLSKGDHKIIFTSIAAILRKLPPCDFISAGLSMRKVGDEISQQLLIDQLIEYGYCEEGLVEFEGSFARRGGIIDLWSPSAEGPFRIEFDGDSIDGIRSFDPATQRSLAEISKIEIAPAREFRFTEASRRKVAHRIRELSDGLSIKSIDRRAAIDSLHEGQLFAGIDTLLPLFHEKTASIFDHLPRDVIIILDDESAIQSAAAEYLKSAHELFEISTSIEKIVSPTELFFDLDEILKLANELKIWTWGSPNSLSSDAVVWNPAIESNTDIKALMKSHADGEDPVAPLARRISSWANQGISIHITCMSVPQAERISEILKWNGIESYPSEIRDLFTNAKKRGVAISIAKLSSGFKWPEEGIAIFTDEEIFGRKVLRKAPKKAPLESFTSFLELSEGDAIVHELHGIGKFIGLSHLEIDGKQGDFMLLEYLGGDKLYLPVYRLNLVGRYIGSGDQPPALDRLGGTRWAAVQKRITHEIRAMARELIEIYAARKAFPGHSFPAIDQSYEEFAAAFPFSETPDQERAIDDVMKDMDVDRPMDRLVCGDVGYGKTEVAMRAAFRATLAGKQVAILVPTTVLALQHFESFKARFAETPVKIAMLSRFASPKEMKDAIAGVANGSVDIAIGTHRLIQEDVKFKNMGLLIIDEEHRFGVKHKERIKKFKSTIDVLTLTATPIPRTLNFSLYGIRDISVINTPPADRLSITTHVTEFDDGLIRRAIMSEIERKGQIFFLHNRVETINSMRDRLTHLVPEARIVIAHGKMKEGELEKAMIGFIEKRFDILLCTTIIESGLDIPSANTIIVNRADTFGLAQLYQIRGRVGRSSVRAYAYLLTPNDREITRMAQKRLSALARFTELGSGFQIAMHDLEFRGAGNLLGSAQSGHISSIGYELYAKLLDRAVRKLKGKEISEEIDPELNLKVSAFLPESYIADQSTRMDIYRRLANREEVSEIAAIATEICDRFGKLPTDATNLVSVMEIKILAKILRIRQLSFDGTNFSCQIDATSPLAPTIALKLVTEMPDRYRIYPPDRLIISGKKNMDDGEILSAAKNSLSELLHYVNPSAKDGRDH